MIEALTPEQEALTSTYRDKWIEIGLDTRTCNREKVEELFPAVYESAGLEVPKIVEWGRSPWEVMEIMEGHGVSRSECRSAFCYGNHDAPWFSFYDYFRNVCDLKKQTEELQPILELSKHVGWFAPFDEAICFCDRPISLNFIKEETDEIVTLHDQAGIAIVDDIKPHGDGRPSIEYRDGTKLYHLHGVEVDEHLVMTPARDLNANMIATISNAEVRREFVRKIGIERLVQELDHEVLDTQDTYSLLLLNIGTERDVMMRPYLRMENPSLAVWHVEGVHPDCKTVDDALAFRNGTKLKPTTLT